LADPRLSLIYRQLKPNHHVLLGGESFLRSATTADHQIVGVIDDPRFQALLVSQLLPAEHEPTHVDVTEQRADR
jgi:uncharacterized protein (DUF736 family)